MQIMLVYQSRLVVLKMKESCHKLSFVHFKKRKGVGENTIKIDDGAQMVVALIINEMSFLVVGLLDDLMGPILYLNS